jgi:hypothetical protein
MKEQAGLGGKRVEGANVWKGDVMLDEEGARRWLEICEAEFRVAESE